MTNAEAMITATYRIHCTPEKAATIARALAWEQTVEVLESVVSEAVRESVVGQVLDIQSAVNPQENGLAQTHFATIGYHAYLASNQIGQLLNLAYGNVSLYPNVRLEHLHVPDQLANAIGGPIFGISGIRQLLGIYDRPLLATVLKPRGESLDYFRRLATDFILGGGDVLKDDQNLVEDNFEAFQQRVTNSTEAVNAAVQKTGRACLYLPHITGSGEQLKRRLELIKSLGIKGVLLCPWVLGLANCKQLAKDFELIYMAHPSLAGTFTRPPGHGIAAEVLYGTLLRLGGADISIFPGHGGRITSREITCDHIHQELTKPLADCKPSLPGPAGGKTLELIPGMLDEYGHDSLLLIGGALLAHGPNLQASTQQFQAAIQARYPGRIEPIVSTTPSTPTPIILKHNMQHGWSQRQSTAYKTDQTLPHANATRTELIGQHGELTHFELRYFELEPGGYTSLEKHQHTHVIIGVKGIGTLIINEQQHELKTNDISYVPPQAVHQLRNNSDALFGFYCLVDRHRDRPQKA